MLAPFLKRILLCSAFRAASACVSALRFALFFLLFFSCVHREQACDPTVPPVLTASFGSGSILSLFGRSCRGRPHPFSWKYGPALALGPDLASCSPLGTLGAPGLSPSLSRVTHALSDLTRAPGFRICFYAEHFPVPVLRLDLCPEGQMCRSDST